MLESKVFSSVSSVYRNNGISEYCDIPLFRFNDFIKQSTYGLQFQSQKQTDFIKHFVPTPELLDSILVF